MSGGTRVDSTCFVKVTDSAILRRVIDANARSALFQCNLNALGISDYGTLSRHGYFKANLNQTPPMELFINGERMILARWPNPNDPAPQELNPYLIGVTGVVCRSGVVDQGLP